MSQRASQLAAEALSGNTSNVLTSQMAIEVLTPAVPDASTVVPVRASQMLTEVMGVVLTRVLTTQMAIEVLTPAVPDGPAPVVVPVTIALVGPDPTSAPSFSGTAPDNVTVYLRIDGSELASTQSDAGGNWSYQPTGPFIVSLHTVTATDDHTSASTTFTYVAPVQAPIITAHLLWDTGPVGYGPGETPVNYDYVSSQSTIIGTATPALLVTISQDGIVIGTAIPDGAGNWSFDPDPEGGSHSYTCEQTDPVNGTGSFTFSATIVRNYSTSSFLRGFLNLLPSGPAWPKSSDSMLSRVLRPLVRVYTRNAGRALDVLTETYPSTTRELLPEWEESLGLVAGTQTIAQRQAAVTAKFALLGGQSIPYIVRFASLLGYTITIIEDATFRVGINHPGDGIKSMYAPFAWQVTAPLAAQGSQLEAQIRQFAPAQTKVGFVYS